MHFIALTAAALWWIAANNDLKADKNNKDLKANLALK